MKSAYKLQDGPISQQPARTSEWNQFVKNHCWLQVKQAICYLNIKHRQILYAHADISIEKNYDFNTIDKQTDRSQR